MNVVVFDMDGTLIAESSWELLHLYFKADAKRVRLNREAYFSGEIDYETWMEKDIELWDSPSLSDVRKGLSHYTLEPFAEEVIHELKARGIIPCIVSSGIDILAREVGRKLEIENKYVFANELVLIDGALKGILRVEPHGKDEVVKRLSRELSIPPEKFAAVGDAAPDISLFKEVGLKCAYKPRDHLIAKAADHVLQDLRELLVYCR